MQDFMLNLVVHLSYHTAHLEGQPTPSFDPTLTLSDLVKYQRAHDHLTAEQVNHANARRLAGQANACSSNKLDLIHQLQALNGWCLEQARDFVLAYLEVHDTRFHYLRRVVPSADPIGFPTYYYVLGEPRIHAPCPVTTRIHEAHMLTRGEARRLLAIMVAQGYAHGFEMVDWECAQLADPPIQLHSDDQRDSLVDDVVEVQDIDNDVIIIDSLPVPDPNASLLQSSQGNPQGSASGEIERTVDLTDWQDEATTEPKLTLPPIAA